jgi:glycyl-tRNA synthetase alpha subunit
MAARHLTAVPHPSPNLSNVEAFGPTPSETTAQRIQRLQYEARLLAREQVEQLARDFNALAARAAEVAQGGEAYPAGVREMASRIAEDLPYKAQGLTILMDRSAAA